MTINYCDWATGNDTTGNGSAGNPYKTITKASEGLTGGDEVRCAKSPDITNLSGTFAFVNGSTTITTSSSQIGILSPGDFIGKTGAGVGSETWYEVITITSTTLTLYGKYCGDTETVAAKKLGVTNTGQADYSQSVQVISSSGSSEFSRLKISGGWDLTTELQTGKTYYLQMHSTFNNRYGYGLEAGYSFTSHYIEISNIAFLRYRINIYLYGCSGLIGYDIETYSSSTGGLYLRNLINSTFNNCLSCRDNYNIFLQAETNVQITNTYLNASNRNAIYNTYIGNSYDLIIDGCTIIYPDNEGIKIDGINLTIKNVDISNANHGIYFYGTYTGCFNCYCENININNVTYGIRSFSSKFININNYNIDDAQRAIDFSKTFNININNMTGTNISQWLLYLSGGHNIIINKLVGIANNSISSAPLLTDISLIKIQHYNSKEDNRCYFDYGVTYNENGILKFDPSSDTYYIRHDFKFKINENKTKNINFYLKKDSDFDGDVQAAIYFLGEKITGWTDVTPSTVDTYERKTLTANAVDIIEQGVIDLAIKVRGTDGYVYLDDIGPSSTNLILD